MSKVYNSLGDTLVHIATVEHYLAEVIEDLTERAYDHDASKLREPEKPIFDKYTPLLRESTYGSEEYKQYLVEMKVALDHHYANNSHHPEHEVHATEKWRDVVGYEGYYQVSNLGRVRSVDRIVPRSGTQGNLTLKGMIRRAHVTPKGYVRIQLRKDNQSHNYMVHVLVAEAFLPPRPSDRHEVNHKSGVKSDNRVSNLEWVTPSENLLHAYENGLREPVVKYIFYCEDLDMAASGAEAMARACHEEGYLQVTASGVYGAAMRDGRHCGLSFSAHPVDQEFPYSGIAGMSLLDLLEMMCDWQAATERHADGDVAKSLEINKERFGIGDQLASILENTAKEMGWIKSEGTR